MKLTINELKKIIRECILEAKFAEKPAIVAYVTHEYVKNDTAAYTKDDYYEKNKNFYEDINAIFRIFGDRFKANPNNQKQLLDFLLAHGCTHIMDTVIDSNPVPLQKWCSARGISPIEVQAASQRTAAIRDLLTPKKRGR